MKDKLPQSSLARYLPPLHRILEIQSREGEELPQLKETKHQRNNTQASFKVETLEPRVLLSATLGNCFANDSLDTALDANSLDLDGTFEDLLNCNAADLFADLCEASPIAIGPDPQSEICAVGPQPVILQPPVVCGEVSPEPVFVEPIVCGAVSPEPVIVEPVPVVDDELSPAPVESEPVVDGEVSPEPVIIETEPVFVGEVSPEPVILAPEPVVVQPSSDDSQPSAPENVSPEPVIASPEPAPASDPQNEFVTVNTEINEFIAILDEQSYPDALLQQIVTIHDGVNETTTGIAGADDYVANNDLGVSFLARGGNDRVFGASGNDLLYGNAGNDLLDGSAGHDILSGGTGNDELKGNDGDDFLLGGDGDDIVDGEAGTDFISGGAGNDIFRFVWFDGVDTIVDFGLGEDRIELININPADVTFGSANGNLTINHRQGLQIVLLGIAPSQQSEVELAYVTSNTQTLFNPTA